MTWCDSASAAAAAGAAGPGILLACLSDLLPCETALGRGWWLAQTLPSLAGSPSVRHAPLQPRSQQVPCLAAGALSLALPWGKTLQKKTLQGPDQTPNDEASEELRMGRA